MFCIYMHATGKCVSQASDGTSQASDGTSQASDGTSQLQKTVSGHGL